MKISREIECNQENENEIENDKQTSKQFLFSLINVTNEEWWKEQRHTAPYHMTFTCNKFDLFVISFKMLQPQRESLST